MSHFADGVMIVAGLVLCWYVPQILGVLRMINRRLR